MGIQSLTIPCKGGLNQAATLQELLSLPGEAIDLVNMEPNKAGGYRRISGFTEYGTTSLPGTGDVKGVLTYKGGVLAARGDALYHSFTGTTWTQVNKGVTGVNNATIVAAPADLPLSTVTEVPLYMEIYTEGTKDHLYGCTGNSAPFYLLIEGTNEATATYTYREVALGTELVGAKYLTIFQDQVILASTTEDPTSFIYSSHATTDLTAAEVSSGLTVREKYDGSTAGIASVKRPITGIKAHKGTLFVFTEKSISAVRGLREGNITIVPITEDVGCIDGNTIQEIGGDLVFLASDGLRTVEQTQRINDLELGVISRRIAPITDFLAANMDKLTFTSAVIRDKNQYRLWYKNSTLVETNQKGIIAAFGYDSTTGGFRWEYGEIEGWEATVASSGADIDGNEFMVHGDTSGKVYQFESGANFDGRKMRWVWQSPFVHFGDIGIRKTLHKVFVNMIPEGIVNARLELLYDYQRENAPQPVPWDLDEQTLTFVLGEFLMGNPLYLMGSNSLSTGDIYTEGSGFTVSFRISDRDLDDSSFNLESLQVDFTPDGRI